MGRNEGWQLWQSAPHTSWVADSYGSQQITPAGLLTAMAFSSSHRLGRWQLWQSAAHTRWVADSYGSQHLTPAGLLTAVAVSSSHEVGC